MKRITVTSLEVKILMTKDWGIFWNRYDLPSWTESETYTPYSTDINPIIRWWRIGRLELFHRIDQYGRSWSTRKKKRGGARSADKVES